MSVFHLIFILSNLKSNYRPEEETKSGNIMNNQDSSAIDDCQSQQVVAKQTNDDSQNIENENDCDATKQDDQNSVLKPPDEDLQTKNDTCCEKKSNNLGLNESSQHQSSPSQTVDILHRIDNIINFPAMVNHPLGHEKSSLKLNSEMSQKINILIEYSRFLIFYEFL